MDSSPGSTGGAPRSSIRRARLSIGGPSDDEFDVIETVATIADELETTSAAVALAWLAARSQTVVPIVGARRLEHLEGNLAGLEVKLGPGASPRPRRGVRAQAQLPGRDERRDRARCCNSPAPRWTAEPSTVYPPLLASDIRY